MSHPLPPFPHWLYCCHPNVTATDRRSPQPPLTSTVCSKPCARTFAAQNLCTQSKQRGFTAQQTGQMCARICSSKVTHGPASGQNGAERTPTRPGMGPMIAGDRNKLARSGKPQSAPAIGWGPVNYVCVINPRLEVCTPLTALRFAQRGSHC